MTPLRKGKKNADDKKKYKIEKTTTTTTLAELFAFTWCARYSHPIGYIICRIYKKNTPAKLPSHTEWTHAKVKEKEWNLKNETFKRKRNTGFFSTRFKRLFIYIFFLLWINVMRMRRQTKNRVWYDISFDMFFWCFGNGCISFSPQPPPLKIFIFWTWYIQFGGLQMVFLLPKEQRLSYGMEKQMKYCTRVKLINISRESFEWKKQNWKCEFSFITCQFFPRYLNTHECERRFHQRKKKIVFFPRLHMITICLINRGEKKNVKLFAFVHNLHIFPEFSLNQQLNLFFFSLAVGSGLHLCARTEAKYGEFPLCEKQIMLHEEQRIW